MEDNTPKIIETCSGLAHLAFMHRTSSLDRHERETWRGFNREYEPN